MSGKKQKKGSRPLVVFLLIVAIAVIIVLVWKIRRLTADVNCAPKVTSNETLYSHDERIINAVALSYLTYGCEQLDAVDNTVSEYLHASTPGIIAENFGLSRTDKEDPHTASFDTSLFIQNTVGSYRCLMSSQNEKTGFFGIAFADDTSKCVWVSYAGAVTWKDCLSCVQLACAPRLVGQEDDAIRFYETVCQCEEIKQDGYSVILTGHSLGGALAAMVSRLSGYDAVTINGAVGLGLRKLNGICGDNQADSVVENHLTSPDNDRFALLDAVQRMMFWGTKEGFSQTVYSDSKLAEDSHSALSFLTFPNGTDNMPAIPSIKEP